MAKKKKGPTALLGSEEFRGTDAQQDAIATAAAARAEADKATPKTHNNGPIMDDDAYKRAGDQLLAEQIELDALAKQAATIRGRISSIRKVAKKENVDWAVVSRYVETERRVMKGETGSIVTEHRKFGQMLRIMGSPLGTQWGLFPEAPTTDEDGNHVETMNGEAELQGQAAYSNNEPLTNNPFPGNGTNDEISRHNDWAHGWTQAQNANARTMGAPPAEASA